MISTTTVVVNDNALRNKRKEEKEKDNNNVCLSVDIEKSPCLPRHKRVEWRKKTKFKVEGI